MTRWDDLHPMTRVSIERQGVVAAGDDPTPAKAWPVRFRCSCERWKAGQVWMCSYHEGYDDGATL